jgi:hypothetical protein
MLGIYSKEVTEDFATKTGGLFAPREPRYKFEAKFI